MRLHACLTFSVCVIFPQTLKPQELQPRMLNETAKSIEAALYFNPPYHHYEKSTRSFIRWRRMTLKPVPLLVPSTDSDAGIQLFNVYWLMSDTLLNDDGILGFNMPTKVVLHSIWGKLYFPHPDTSFKMGRTARMNFRYHLSIHWCHRFSIRYCDLYRRNVSAC